MARSALSLLVASVVVALTAVACQAPPPTTTEDGVAKKDAVSTKEKPGTGGPRSGAGAGADSDDDDDPGAGAHAPANSGAGPNSACPIARDLASPDTLRASVTFLASEELQGRMPGTPGDVAARKHVEDFFRCVGLEPGGDNGGYQQAFVNVNKAPTANVIGVLRGTDPTVGAETIVIAAHHDHFGTIGGKGLRLGANDNASGVAGLLAIAGAIKAHGPLRRTVAFIAFGSEETLEAPPWDEGSDFYVSHPPAALPLDKVVHVMTMDMIGTYNTQTNVDAMGTATGTPGRAMLDALLPRYAGLHVTLAADAEEGDSDFDPFCRRGVPYIGFYTADDACYHKDCDTADRIDYANMSRIVKLATDINVELASSTLDLAAAKRSIRDACQFSK